MSEKKLITEEGKARLLLVMKETIEFNTGQMDMIRPFIKNIAQMGESRETLGLGPSSVEHGLIRLSEYNLLLGFISLDLCAAYRVYLKADINYEVMYATKHLIVILNEAYKKIYNYVWPNDKGNLLMKDRNKSFWIKDIGQIIRLQIPELKDEYDRLTKALDDYYDPELRAMKTPRDMFIHYDDRPSELYDVLCTIDIQITTEKIIPFLEILKQMMEFTMALQYHYTIYTVRTTEQAFPEHRQLLENMKADKADNPAAIAEIEKGLERLSELEREHKKSSWLK
jgi:hypothetical protein